MKEKILESIKAINVIRLNSDKNVFQLVEVLESGGIPIVEITLTTPNALSLVGKISNGYSDEITVGVGSVLIQTNGIKFSKYLCLYSWYWICFD